MVGAAFEGGFDGILSTLHHLEVLHISLNTFIVDFLGFQSQKRRIRHLIELVIVAAGEAAFYVPVVGYLPILRQRIFVGNIFDEFGVGVVVDGGWVGYFHLKGTTEFLITEVPGNSGFGGIHFLILICEN